MVSQRRLFNFLTVLIFISLFVVACERPLTNPDDGADQTNQNDDANAGGGTDGSGDSTTGDTGDGTTDTGDTSGDAGTGDQGDGTTDGGDDAATDGDDGSQDDSDEAGGGAGDAGDTDDTTDSGDDGQSSGDTDDSAGDDSGTDDSSGGDDAADDGSTDDSSGDDSEDNTGDDAADTTIPETHTVAAGENLYRIGLKYGISWVAIANENNLANPNIVTVGQVLKLPGASTPDPDPGPTPSPQTETTYIVKAGDNLYRIGLRFGISWVQIAEANGLVNPNLIKVGDELKIPVNTPGPAPQFSHVVKQGETLFLISLQYGVAWPAIAEANNLASPYVIYVGQTLEIPGSQ